MHLVSYVTYSIAFRMHSQFLVVLTITIKCIVQFRHPHISTHIHTPISLEIRFQVNTYESNQH